MTMRRLVLFAALASLMIVSFPRAPFAQSPPSFTPPGGGASRSLQSGDVPTATQWNSFFSAKQNSTDLREYGAKCDGSTDDTSSIQAWANAAAGGNITLTNYNGGTCIFKSPIIFPIANWVTIAGIGRSTLFEYAGSATNTSLMYLGPSAILTGGTGGSASTTLAVTAVGGNVAPFVGMLLQPQTGIPTNTTITACPGGTCGGTGNYTLSQSVTLAAGSVINDIPSGSSCGINGWSIHGFRTLSSTVMTAGDGVRLTNLCNADISDIYAGGWIGGNNNLYNSIHFNSGNSIRVRGYSAEGSNRSVLINGGSSNQFTDPYFEHGQVLDSGCGVEIGGNVGGFHMDTSDVLENGCNVLISQNMVAIANLQVVLGSGSAIDVTNPSLYPSASQIGLEISDPGSSNSWLTLNGTWIASASEQCVLIDSGVNWRVNWTGGNLGNCNGAGAGHGEFENQSTNSTNQYNITGVRAIDSSSGTPSIYNVSGANPIMLSGVAASDSGFNISSNVGGFYINSAGQTIWSDWSSVGTTNFLLNGANDSDGINVKLLGNGSTTPAKFIRSYDGLFQILNNAYSASLITITDAGAVSLGNGGALSNMHEVWGTLTTGANPPTLSSCGTSPSINSASNNNAGYFTMGTGGPTSCTLTWATPYPTWAFCTFTPGPAAYTGTFYVSTLPTASKTAVTLTLGTGNSSGSFYYSCNGS
jgi:hypothetical protein